MPRQIFTKEIIASHQLATPGAINRPTEKGTHTTRNGDGGIHKREIVRDGKHR